MSTISMTHALDSSSSSGEHNNNIHNNFYKYIKMPIWEYKKQMHMDDSVLQAHVAASAPPQLMKSNSYSGGSTIPVIAALDVCSSIHIGSNDQCNTTKILAHESSSSSVLQINSNEIDEDGVGSTEYDAFLINSTSNSGVGSVRRTTRGMRARAHSFLTRNWYLGPLSILGALFFVIYITRDYTKQMLFWVERQNSWLIFVIFMALFILVSFPVVVGYFVLLITAGYLFGCWKGWLTTILGANLGIAVAHITIRSCRHRIPIQKLIKNETGRAILRVISGPRAFKVVLFTRLTPIPFGIQNVIFGISSINSRDYHLGTLLGLLPAQTINVYLGSTLRSMHEVLNNNDAKLPGYISFVIEVICGVGLMLWVIHKARKELSETLLNDYNSDGKLLDIQV